VAIFVLVLWIATAAAGITLLKAGGAARRVSMEAEAVRDGQPVAVPVRIGAPPMTEDGKPPPIPHVRVKTPAGEHPMLEFSHPTLAVTGLCFWAMFTFVHYRPFAWVAVCVVVLTIGIGLGWLAANRRAERHKAPGAWRFPPRLATLHGASATLTIILAVVSALVASHA
jgi:hypothetical protein